MSPNLSRRVYVLSENPTRRIDAIRERLLREGKDLYMLSTGQPSIPPPAEMREYLAVLLREESMRLYGYTPSSGISELREAIVEDLERLGGPRVDPDSQLVVTAGGQAGMFVALSTIVEEGDEVVLMEPTYFGYRPLVEYLGARLKVLPTGVESGFQPDVEKLKGLVSRRTKALVLVSPDNPTGRIVDPEAARAIADLAVDYDFWIVYDEAYKTIIYEGEHVWVYRMAPDNTIGVDVFSKDPGVPGWRLGFLYGPREFIERAKLVNERVTYCPPSFAQVAIAYYLRERLRDRFLPRVLEVYRSRRDALARALRRHLPEARFEMPRGGMFIFADFAPYLRRLGVTAEELAERLLMEVGVAVIPGVFFGESCRDYIRFSFVAEPEERIERAVEAIGKYVEDAE